MKTDNSKYTEHDHRKVSAQHKTDTGGFASVETQMDTEIGAGMGNGMGNGIGKGMDTEAAMHSHLMHRGTHHGLMQDIGSRFVDICHYVILFSIGLVVVWAAGSEFLMIVHKGKAALKDILMLFIYLELLAMIGIYFKTHRLPVQFLIFIAITALSRHLVVDVQAVSESFHLWLLATISLAIFILSLSIVVLTWTAQQFGRPEDNITPIDGRSKRRE